LTAANGDEQQAAARAEARELDAIYPLAFSGPRRSASAWEVYLSAAPAAKLVQFFESKGLAALKQEEQREQWYDDWLSYQAEHRIYASVLSPQQFSSFGSEFDLLSYARFLEVFGYFSPGHGYSAQVTFLGLFAILMGSNDALKREAVAALERGAVLAFGVSEKHHGSDLLGNEFTVREISPGRFTANGPKYYIGNCNVAAIICTLAKKDTGRSRATSGASRAPIALFALRPARSRGFSLVQKIRTLGVRQAFVGAFAVKDHEFLQDDLIAEGRQAWDAVLGSVTLGKFFLGFGSIGICEHALCEAITHLSTRILYGKPVIAMPHIRATMAQAYVRLTMMKLFAYRAIDYVQSASEQDRRYLMFCAAQKARVSTEGMKVMGLLSECVGAKGFEAETYFEMALRDVQLIPGLESSAHINLGLTAQFAARYFANFDRDLSEPACLFAGDSKPRENAYLFEARASALHTIAFPPTLNAYRPHVHVHNVRVFIRQITAFRRVLRRIQRAGIDPADTQFTMALGWCISTIAYGQLIAEQARLLSVDPRFVSAMFQLLVADLHAATLAIVSLPSVPSLSTTLIRRALAIPRTGRADWDFVAARMDVR
jgi:acyl-CoA dehydrogenase